MRLGVYRRLRRDLDRLTLSPMTVWSAAETMGRCGLGPRDDPGGWWHLQRLDVGHLRESAREQVALLRIRSLPAPRYPS
jgi:hypothetical protein